MSQYPVDILAFFARGREIGFVLLHHAEIQRYGIKTIRGPKQGAEFKTRVAHALLPILDLIEPPGIVVTEQCETHRRLGKLCHILPLLLRHFADDATPPVEIPLSEVKRSLCKNAKATHSELTDTMVHRHPTLWSLIRNVTRQKAQYWRKLIMALALAEAVRSRYEATQKV